MQGQAFAVLQQFEDALANYGKALGLDPDRAGFHAVCSQVWIALERHESGSRDYDPVLEIDPDDADVRYHLDAAQYS